MKRTLVLVVALVTVLGTAAVGSAQEAERPERALPEHISDLKLDNPVSASGVVVSDKIDEGLFGATGKVRVSIRLTNDPVAEVAATGARADQQKIQLRTVLAQQTAVHRGPAGPGRQGPGLDAGGPQRRLRRNRRLGVDASWRPTERGLHPARP